MFVVWTCIIKFLGILGGTVHVYDKDEYIYIYICFLFIVYILNILNRDITTPHSK